MCILRCMQRFGFDWCSIVQWRYDSVIKNLYASFLQKSHVHMRTYFWVVTYRFFSMDRSICRYASWLAHTYTEVSYKGHIHNLGFCCIWCLTNPIVFVVVCWWSLSWWFVFDNGGWGWNDYVMKCRILMMLLWDYLYVV